MALDEVSAGNVANKRVAKPSASFACSASFCRRSKRSGLAVGVWSAADGALLRSVYDAFF